MNKSILMMCGLVASLLPAMASAYVGPGAGITMLGALWGVFLAILAALGAVLYWPIRSVIRKRRKRLAAKTEPVTIAAGEESLAHAGNDEPSGDERGD